jgi:hypothetical protein
VANDDRALTGAQGADPDGQANAVVGALSEESAHEITGRLEVVVTTLTGAVDRLIVMVEELLAEEDREVAPS